MLKVVTISSSGANRVDDAEEVFVRRDEWPRHDVCSFAAYDGYRYLQGVVIEASHPGGLIKSGVRGNTAAFAHFDFAAPLAVFCAHGSPCRHRPGGRLCLLVLTAKATQPCPDFSALRRVECHASETWAHSAWSPHLSSLLDYPRAKRKVLLADGTTRGRPSVIRFAEWGELDDWISGKPNGERNKEAQVVRFRSTYCRRPDAGLTSCFLSARSGPRIGTF